MIFPGLFLDSVWQGTDGLTTIDELPSGKPDCRSNEDVGRIKKLLLLSSVDFSRNYDSEEEHDTVEL